MVDLAFAVAGVEVEPHAAAPTLIFKIAVTSTAADAAIENILLQCQLRIEPTQRRYAPEDHDRLFELFGEPHRWSETVRSMLWTHASVQVPAFASGHVVDLPVPCSFDLNIAATKYFYGLGAGEVPLSLLFSGTIFYRDADDLLQMAQIPWSREATCRLPLRLWQEMMERYYPNSNWLRIDRAIFDRLYRYKRRRHHISWDDTLQALLAEQEEKVQ